MPCSNPGSGLGLGCHYEETTKDTIVVPGPFHNIAVAGPPAVEIVAEGEGGGDNVGTNGKTRGGNGNGMTSTRGGDVGQPGEAGPPVSDIGNLGKSMRRSDGSGGPGGSNDGSGPTGGGGGSGMSVGGGGGAGALGGPGRPIAPSAPSVSVIGPTGTSPGMVIVGQPPAR